MQSIVIVIVLNLALAGWVLWLLARDPGNIFKRRPPADPPAPPAAATPDQDPT